jgi:hypothetical protein
LEAEPPKKKQEDTAAGCRSMAQDDRDRAVISDSDRMRFRLACSAEAWSARAEMLDRMEANRARVEGEPDTPEADDGATDNDGLEEKNDG